MKVLQINKFLYPKGGSETYMFQLSEVLKKQGVDIEFWGMHDQKNVVKDTFHSFAKNISYQKGSFLKTITKIQRTIYSFENKQRISKILDSYQPDIVHLHNYNFQLTPSILPQIKKRGIKIVQTIHDSQMICPYHRLYNFQKDKVCTKCVKGSFSNCIKDKCFDGSIFKSFVGATESYFYHHSNYYEKYIDQFIAPSKFLANLIKKRIKGKVFHIIPNFTEKLKTIDNCNGSYYLYFGRISNEKGILELIDIFKEINLKLLIIGSGKLENKLKEKIKGIKHISFLGSKSGKELFTYVASAKFVIQPSKGYENCPMTVIESFTYGTPVIASDHSGFRDLIKDKQTGFLLDFSHKNKIKEQLLEIDKADTKRLGLNIEQFYNKNLKKEIHISFVLKIYQEILQQ